ncbi:ATP-binding cassette domain-containing protein [Massilia pinisoli]|uniref:ATP-binding cassette domain-containing protein n=1 Tax=Massilia pinisoli TaxID=1772194 RepID=A0ABT1ZSM1_9BURK|nr:ATP-binding cassette domain-containing protein [Massilia pinisoli]MCS0582913.1 ATP-binding cassette domain-containing protein [Massilia pinisoli]
MSDYAIDTEALCLSYGNKLALDHLTLKLPRGVVHTFIGANGAGKSSLFRVLLGFEQASAGSARVLGHDHTCLTPAQRERIGYVNEEHALPGWMRVRELKRMHERQYARWNEARYHEVIHHFDVMPEQRVCELSRGERAGLSLALALSQCPELLILDEPTLGLDVVAKRVFLDTLLETTVFDNDGATIAFCSHQMDEIERVADNLVILEHGRLRYMNGPADFCERIRLWVAAFPFKTPDIWQLPGVLQAQTIEGHTHLVVFDQDDSFGARLKLLGAQSVQTIPLGLERAVNAFLTHGHAGTSRRAA